MSGDPDSGAAGALAVMDEVIEGMGGPSDLGLGQARITVQEIIQELDAKDACLTMIHVELQYHAPWSESNDMDPADEIMCGLGLLVQDRDALIAERDELRAALIEVRDNARDDSPDIWDRVELALDFATTAKARKAFDDAVVEMARPGGKP